MALPIPIDCRRKVIGLVSCGMMHRVRAVANQSNHEGHDGTATYASTLHHNPLHDRRSETPYRRRIPTFADTEDLEMFVGSAHDELLVIGVVPVRG